TSLTVARCEACAGVHRRVNRRIGQAIAVGLGGMICLTVGVFSAGLAHAPDLPVFLTWWSWNYPLLPVVFFLLAVPLLLLWGLWSYHFMTLVKRSGIREQENTRMYPPLRVLWEEGYRYGATPADPVAKSGKYDAG